MNPSKLQKVKIIYEPDKDFEEEFSSFIFEILKNKKGKKSLSKKSAD